MELFQTFTSEDYAVALESWSWLSHEPLQPKFTSLFGAVFFAAQDNAVWFLDPLEGTLSREWDTQADMRTDLGTEQGAEWYLMATFAQAAQRRGLVLDAGQVYDFLPSPVLTGEFSPDSIQVVSFRVALNVAGQLHRQLLGAEHDQTESARVRE